MEKNWKDLLRGYNPQVDTEYTPFVYTYPIKINRKNNIATSILFNVDGRTAFIPISKLRVDRRDVAVGSGWVYIDTWIYEQKLKELQEKKLKKGEQSW